MRWTLPAVVLALLATPARAGRGEAPGGGPLAGGGAGPEALSWRRKDNPHERADTDCHSLLPCTFVNRGR